MDDKKNRRRRQQQQQIDQIKQQVITITWVINLFQKGENLCSSFLRQLNTK
jgi:hypothetical protein